jgi:recombination protein RecR
MMNYRNGARAMPQAVEDTIAAFHRLPGIGPKTAERLTFFLLREPKEGVDQLAFSIADLRNRVKTCSVCCNISEQDPCPICSDESRDHTQICVVEEPLDMVALERTGQYRGVYHILHGAISPIGGIGPEDMRIPELLNRARGGQVKEILLATNPNLEGNATAFYLERALKPFGVRITRLAVGLPVGGDLAYADEITLGRALEGRQEIIGDVGGAEKL